MRRKSKIAAALLAFFFGGLGIHKFYLGRTSMGLWYLVFSWTGIPCILAFIEFFQYLFWSDEKFDAKYNPGYYCYENYDQPNHSNTADEIEKLYQLKEKGVITEEEFQNHKKKLL
ncbi:MAG: NINE protein [Prevotella sp.]|nr:NINE protein [Prevotella sp.]